MTITKCSKLLFYGSDLLFEFSCFFYPTEKCLMQFFGIKTNVGGFDLACITLANV